MKKSPKTKTSGKGDAESDLRETLRQFARKVLSTQKLRDSAAKKIGSSPSYMRAMLNQRGIGGFDLWTALAVHCFDILGVDLLTILSNALRDPERLKTAIANGQTPSEMVFKNLDQITIVNEDVKFQLATHLEKMLKDIEKTVQNHGKRS